MANEVKYLSQIEASDGTILYIRDAEAWAQIQQMGGRIEVVTVTALPDPNGTIPAGQEHAGEKYGEFYYGKIVLTNEASAGTSNSYDEYIIRRWKNTGESFFTYDWEKIGTTDINMAGFSSKGHVHPVDTHVSVDDHTFTPSGTVNVALTTSGTQSVTVQFTPQGTVRLQDTNSTEYNGESGAHNILPFTPSGSVTGSSDDAGEHVHPIDKRKKYMSVGTVNFSTGTNPTLQKLVKETVNNFVESTDDAHKAAHIQSSENIHIARVTDPTGTTVPTVNTAKTVNLSFTGGGTNNFVTGVATPGNNESADVVSEAVAETIDGDVNGYYRLSFTGKKLSKASAVTGIGTPNWGSNGTPLGSSAFGTTGIPLVQNYKNGNSDRDFPWKTFGTDIQVPKLDSNNPTKTVATGSVSSNGSGANVVTGVTDNTMSLNGLLSYSGELPKEYSQLEYVQKNTNAVALSSGVFDKRVVMTICASYYESILPLLEIADDICVCLKEGYIIFGSSSVYCGNALTQVELIVHEERDGITPMILRVRVDEGHGWGDWSNPIEIDADTGTAVLHDGVMLSNGAPCEKIIGASTYDAVTGVLVNEWIPADYNNTHGLFDKISDHFSGTFSNAGNTIQQNFPLNVPFYDSIDGGTGASGKHNHPVSANFTGNTKYLKATFTGTQGTATGTTPATVVDAENTGFTGNEMTLEHGVHNPRVYTGVDDFEADNRFYDWYGIEYDETTAASAKTRVGNMTMHKTLPIQGKMRRCLLLDDGTVFAYLDKNDSRYYAAGSRDPLGRDISGLEAGLAGTVTYLDADDTTSVSKRVNVMVEVPHHWRKVVRDSETNVVRAMVSPYHQDGWVEVPTYYVGAFEGKVTSNKMRSVSDGGYPTRSISLEQFRTAARENHRTLDDGTTPDYRWNVLTYKCYVDLYWLYVIEYANTNSQAAFDDALSADGYVKGGLGVGVTNCSTNTFDVCKCGATAKGAVESPSDTSTGTDNLGNNSGYITIAKPNDQFGNTYPVSYRGIENIFGAITKLLDGIVFRGKDIMVCDSPSLFYSPGTENALVANNYNNNYTVIGEKAAVSGTLPTITKMLIGSDGFGHIIPTETNNGSKSLYYCDSYSGYDSSDSGSGTYQCAMVGGGAGSDVNAGLAYLDTRKSVVYKNSSSGARLCFLPNGNEL